MYWTIEIDVSFSKECFGYFPNILSPSYMKFKHDANCGVY